MPSKKHHPSWCLALLPFRLSVDRFSGFLSIGEEIAGCLARSSFSSFILPWNSCSLSAQKYFLLLFQPLKVEAESPILSNVASAASTLSLARTLLSVVVCLGTLLLHDPLTVARATIEILDLADSNGPVARGTLSSFSLT